MKYLILSLSLLLIFSNGYTQIKSYDYYWGDFAFIYRNINSNLTPKIISDNKIRLIKEKDSLYSNSILAYCYYDSKGNWIKTKIKQRSLKSKIVSPIYQIRNLFSKKKYLPRITKIDSTENGQINSIQYNDFVDGNVEKYAYDKKGNLINIKFYRDTNYIVTDSHFMKEIELDYDSTNILVSEKVFYCAGDSNIIKHEYKSNQIIRSVSFKYNFEYTVLGDNKIISAITKKPKIETVCYYYMDNGLLENIIVRNGLDNSFRYIKFEYEKFQ